LPLPQPSRAHASDARGKSAHVASLADYQLGLTDLPLGVVLLAGSRQLAVMVAGGCPASNPLG
jgi:hypothetical protein